MNPDAAEVVLTLTVMAAILGILVGIFILVFA